MIDIDFYKNDRTEIKTEDIINNFKLYCQKYPELKFRLYSSRNGIHGFLISHEGTYATDKFLKMELDLESDFYYVVYSYLRGWSVRLNKKEKDTKDILYEYICDIGEGHEIQHLTQLVDLHIKLVDVFKNTGKNTMTGG